MKETFRTILALMAGSMVFPACNDETMVIEGVSDNHTSSQLREMVFTAIQEKQDGTTKATIDGVDIKWSASDSISVFDGSDNRPFTLDGEGGSTSANFTGWAVAASTYYAIYPYQSGSTLSEDKVTTETLPAEQTVAEGQSVDPKAILMMAVNTDADTLSFKNVCAYVKVTPKFDCSRIELSSKGSENLAGTVTLDYNGGAPVAEVTANGTHSVSLTGAITSGKAYYIAVLPAVLESGFTLKFQTESANYKKDTNNKLVLTRNKVMNLGAFSTSDLTLVSFTGFFKLFEDIDGPVDATTGYGMAW